MIFPPEFQNRNYLLYDAPATVEAIIRYIIQTYNTADSIEQGEANVKTAFGLDQPGEQLDKLG